MRKCANSYFCSSNAIFLVCRKKIWVRNTKFCCWEFATFCCKFLLPYVKFLKRSTKVCCIFLGWWGVKASLWTACCCQKYLPVLTIRRLITWSNDATQTYNYNFPVQRSLDEKKQKKNHKWWAYSFSSLFILDVAI